jgi:hypothetical protein
MEDDIKSGYNLSVTTQVGEGVDHERHEAVTFI